MGIVKLRVIFYLPPKLHQRYGRLTLFTMARRMLIDLRRMKRDDSSVEDISDLVCYIFYRVRPAIECVKAVAKEHGLTSIGDQPNDILAEIDEELKIKRVSSHKEELEHTPRKINGFTPNP